MKIEIEVKACCECPFYVDSFDGPCHFKVCAKKNGYGAIIRDKDKHKIDENCPFKK